MRIDGLDMDSAPLLELRAEKLCYVATVYSKHADGIDAAFEDACFVAGQLMREGVKVFSPIAHSHAVASVNDFDPFDHSFWLPQDAPLMDACSALIVARMSGWRESTGVTHEIEAFQRAGKPVYYLDVLEL